MKSTMIFKEIEPNENFDLRRFQSLPSGRWEAGILKMLWGKARVRIALAQSDGWVSIDYWGGDHQNSFIILGFLLAILTSFPEEIEEHDLVGIFPEQQDKDTGPQFWQSLFRANDQARSIYGDFQE
jgi:hypothetical protein